MPKGSEELTAARREEIINACEKLYRTMRFKEITIKEIGRETSFTRTSIYNYFETKEEIFLALLKREYDCWCESLAEIAACKDERAELAELLARSLEAEHVEVVVHEHVRHRGEQPSGMFNGLQSFFRQIHGVGAGVSEKIFSRHGRRGTKAVYLFVFSVHSRDISLYVRDGKAEMCDEKREGGVCAYRHLRNRVSRA